MIDPVLSLQCRAVRMVPLVTFGVPVMTPAESPQDRRRPKMTDHILAILSARDGHGRWSGPDQDHARRSTCLPGHCTALAWPGDAVVAAVHSKQDFTKYIFRRIFSHVFSRKSIFSFIFSRPAGERKKNQLSFVGLNM